MTVNRDLRVVFMGTPGFAVPSLRKLLEEGINVVGVVTAPDKPSGRGLKVRTSAVKKFARKHDLHTLQPDKLKSPQFLKELRAMDPQLQIVVAFRILPREIWEFPEYGTINLHASLLPDYRGAAPIHRAIINGEKTTGVTTFFLKQKVDTGDIIFQEKTPIGPEETAGELHDRLSILGAKVILRTVRSISRNNVPGRPQTSARSSKIAPKIFKKDCEIDWKTPPGQLFDFIRGLSPYPAAWTHFNGKIFRIFRVAKEQSRHDQSPGQVTTDNQSYMKVAVNGGYLYLKEVQLEGKKKMNIGDFLNGIQPSITPAFLPS